jgi:hypothetical protein
LPNEQGSINPFYNIGSSQGDQMLLKSRPKYIPTRILPKLLGLQLFFVKKVAKYVIRKCDFEKVPKQTSVYSAKIRPIWPPWLQLQVIVKSLIAEK